MADRRWWENPATLRQRDWYVYTAAVDAIAVGGNANDTIPIEADSDFILQKLTFWADIAGVAVDWSTRVMPNVSVLIKDTGIDRDWETYQSR